MLNCTAFWSLGPEEIYRILASSSTGLSEEEAMKRCASKTVRKELSPLIKDALLFFHQFRSPLTLLLFFGLLFSFLLGEITNSLIILTILLLSGTLGYIQERKADRAAEKLRRLVEVKTTVMRNGNTVEIPSDELAHGDIILLNAGDIIPADCFILNSTDLYVNQSALTGESFPAEKITGTVPAAAPLAERYNAVYKGSNVVSGVATVIAIDTGKETEFGKIENSIEAEVSETAFDIGLKKFGFTLMRTALVLAGTILIFNISTGKNALDSLLFGLALSLGITPELLPAILTITLSTGARRLAKQKVIVKKLSAIQNLGSIDVLCSDKTGTLTEGTVTVHSYLSIDDSPSALVQKFAYLNSIFESGYTNPIDDAIRSQAKVDINEYEKFDEVPFDFIRKRLSIVVANEGRHVMITKGAVDHVMEVCDAIQLPNGEHHTIENYKSIIEEQVRRFSEQGYRIIGIAVKDVTENPVIGKDDEQQMNFLGIVTLNDPLKEGIADTIQELKNKNVSLKIITGDNLPTAVAIAEKINIPAERVIPGDQIDKLDDNTLVAKIPDIDVFAGTVPAQKERIVKALQRNGHVVGYLGDGINDAAALTAADVGISVNNAVDIAKESSDIILLEKHLDVITNGITEGRKTHLNTLKYIFITVSANFGNMFSMAAASFLLPFLPLLPSQILLTNLLTDLPALSISSDSVDEELLQKPRRWDINLIKNFMIIFGLESSIFDFITFGVLMQIMHVNAQLFRTGWFIESVITEVFILLIIRTRRTFFRSMPGKLLAVISGIVIISVLIIPFLPFSAHLGFQKPSYKLLGLVLAIAVLYGTFGELTKKLVFKKMKY